MSMEAMMREIARMSGQDEPKPPALIVEALRDEAQFFARENPFKVGDIVTPRAGTDMTGTGEPHIAVVDVEGEYAHHVFKGAPSSNSFGQRLDLRVLSWNRGTYFPHWVESASFEPWVEKAAETDPASEAA